MTSPSPDAPQPGQPGQPGGYYEPPFPPPPAPPGGYVPGYGPYGYPYLAPPRPGTNTMAILALVFAFVFSPLGIVFGCVSLSQLKRSPQDGRGLAIAGIAVGAAFTVLFVIYAIVLIAVVNNVVDHLPYPNPTSSL